MGGLYGFHSGARSVRDDPAEAAMCGTLWGTCGVYFGLIWPILIPL